MYRGETKASVDLLNKLYYKREQIIIKSQRFRPATFFLKFSTGNIFHDFTGCSCGCKGEATKVGTGFFLRYTG